MGREVYGGSPNDGANYTKGVSTGASGLMVQLVVLGITSLPLEKLCCKLGAGFFWGICNVLMALCFLGMLIVSYVNTGNSSTGRTPPTGVVAAAIAVFAVLGIPLAITYSVPYALISTRIESLGLGQDIPLCCSEFICSRDGAELDTVGWVLLGLSLGVLNLAIVIPQFLLASIGTLSSREVSKTVSAIADLSSGLVAILAIPRSSTQIQKLMATAQVNF